MTSLKTSIKTITYLSDIGCLEIQGASLPSFGRAFSLSQHDSSADSPINPALLPNISQVEMDIAIAKSATGHQPELFNLSC